MDERVALLQFNVRFVHDVRNSEAGIGKGDAQANCSPDSRDQSYDAGNSESLANEVNDALCDELVGNFICIQLTICYQQDDITTLQ